MASTIPYLRRAAISATDHHPAPATRLVTVTLSLRHEAPAGSGSDMTYVASGHSRRATPTAPPCSTAAGSAPGRYRPERRPQLRARAWSSTHVACAVHTSTRIDMASWDLDPGEWSSFNSLGWYPRHRSDALRARSTRPGAPLPPSQIGWLFCFVYCFHDYTRNELISHLFRLQGRGADRRGRRGTIGQRASRQYRSTTSSSVKAPNRETEVPRAAIHPCHQPCARCTRTAKTMAGIGLTSVSQRILQLNHMNQRRSFATWT
jgi:hypothetical protein